ncbi:phospholipid/cholesterol/gamma-HCH transport system substrate-binding protein [Roseiarcus fermentans]|uniref:Phospholipid/cholesterol/gamma-HCH transport system substrate-binding protein n=1 Tax=Roseiarcus fermentans TaxID=1473586 RepID=A0A366ETD3_9HYPH|nr:MlaD family protein [Roseiarcus fermentans]RBP05657.1 phospholipid/cholesterol/gamma-HCH transport system substrate-binding protein [Roseiarcus fermentans]
METRANFVLIGAFTLAAVIGAFAFLMWIVGLGTGSHRHYQVVFSGSVSGLSVGSNVLFNGLKVGEVTNLSFVKDNPTQVIADIDVTNGSAPINASTKAQLETQGLTGTGVVALKGGEVKGAAELKGSPPVIASLPTATLADLQTKAGYVLDLANKLLVDNAVPIHQTIENVQQFSMALGHNAGRVDEALAAIADLGKVIQPLASKAQLLAQDADTLIKSIDSAKVNEVIGNAQVFSRALANSAGNTEAVMRDGAAFIKRLNEASSKLDSAIGDIDAIAKAVDPDKVANVVNAASEVANTVRQNRVNIDATLKNAAEISATLRESADKLDGLMTAAQSFLGSPGTKSALGQVGDAAASIKKLADDIDARVKEISVGLTRFSGSGLRQYEALAVQGQRVLDDVDRLVRSFERNPSQILFGNKPSLPEYNGR